MHNLKSIIYRTMHVLDKEGLASLSKRAFAFIIHQIIIYQDCYLVKKSLKEMKENPDDFLPDIHNLSYKYVKSNPEADKIIKELSDFRRFHLNGYERLEKGAIAFCIFIGADLAYINWAAMTEDAMKTFNDIPCKVNLDKKEIYVGGETTIPKYRKKGLSTYGRLYRDRLLKNIGVENIYGVVRKNDFIAVG